MGCVQLDKLLSKLDIQVRPVALCLTSAGWRLRLPASPDPMLHFVLRGRGAILGPEDDPHAVGPHSMVIVPCGTTHAIESEGDVRHEQCTPTPSPGVSLPRLSAGPPDDPDVIVACGVVRVRYGDSLGLFSHLRGLLTIDLSASPQVGAAIQGILAEQSQASPGSEALQAALMNQCLVHMFRHLCGHTECQLPWLRALDNPRLARAIDRILEDPGADHTVESLAEVATMSRSAFAPAFASAFGRPPMTLVHQVRMQRAAQLLQRPDTTMDEIADRVGFASRSHFSRAFKKQHGTSPGAYRSNRPPPAAG